MRLQNIDTVLESFAAMQDEHNQALASGNLKDLMSWIQNRARVFGLLKQCLDQAVQDAGIRQETQLVDWLRERVGALLEGERSLESQATMCRKRLENQMGAMRKGKNALKRYGRKNGLSLRPRVFSNRT